MKDQNKLNLKKEKSKQMVKENINLNVEKYKSNQFLKSDKNNLKKKSNFTKEIKLSIPKDKKEIHSIIIPEENGDGIINDNNMKKKLESEYNPWNNEVNFIQDTGIIKEFLDFCQINLIKKYQYDKKGNFFNNIKEEKSKYLNKLNNITSISPDIKKIQLNIIRHDVKDETLNKTYKTNYIYNEEDDINLLCNYITNDGNTTDRETSNEKVKEFEKADLFNKIKSEAFLKTYEKYQNKNKDENENFYGWGLYGENRNNSNKNEKIKEIDEKENVNNLLYGKNCFIDILDRLNSLSLDQFKKGIEMEDLYEKYRFENLLSKEKIDFIFDTISNLNEILIKIDNSRVKISTLIHNNSLTDNTFIRIKHSKKFNLIKCLKLINSQVKSNDTLELIFRSSNLSANTLKLINNKFAYLAKEIGKICNNSDYKKLLK